MATLKFRINSTPMELIGTSEEIADFIKNYHRSITKEEPQKIVIDKNLDMDKALKTETDRNEIPSVKEITEFLKNRDEFRHTARDVHTHFLGMPLSVIGETARDFNRMDVRLRKARKKLAEEYNGKWESKWKGAQLTKGGIKEYWLVMNKE